MNNLKKAIFGAGGFAREVYHHMLDDNLYDITFFVDDEFAKENIKPLSEFDPSIYEIIIAVGNPLIRKQIVKKLPEETKYFTYIHKSAQILDKNIKIGRGSIICANCILTTNIELGEHVHLNLSTTIGHDTSIGDYFTSAPGVHISGNCTIKNCVYFGTNASLKEKKYVEDYSIVGLNAGVVKDIKESGTYIGCPATKIK